MSGLTIKTPPDAAPRDDITAIRAALIGNRITIAQASAAFNVTDRWIYKAIEQHQIPYVKVFGVRYIAINALREALVKEVNASPKGRGRPRTRSAEQHVIV